MESAGMIYVLIFVMTQYQRAASVGSVEFNSNSACQAAASALYRQAARVDNGLRVDVAICAEKGEKK